MVLFNNMIFCPHLLLEKANEYVMKTTHNVYILVVLEYIVIYQPTNMAISSSSFTDSFIVVVICLQNIHGIWFLVKIASCLKAAIFFLCFSHPPH